MANSSMEAIGIDIGSYSIKAVLTRVRQESGEPSFHGACVPTPVESVQRGVVLKPREVAAQIRELMKLLRTTSSQAAISVTMEQSVLRWLDFPPMDGEMLAAAAPFEAKKFLTFPLEQAEIAVEAVSKSNQPASEGVHAMLTATRSEIVASRAIACEYAGLEVAFAELEPSPMIRAEQQFSKARGKFWRGLTTGLLMLGEETSGLILYCDGSPTFMRSIPWGSGRLWQGLAEEKSLSVQEARTLMHAPTTRIDTQGKLLWEKNGEIEQSVRIQQELQPLLRETSRLLSYYRSLFTERSFSGTLASLSICGGVAALSGLESCLTRSLEVRAHKIWDSLPQLEIEGNSYLTDPCAYPVAVGLSLRLLDTKRQRQRSRGRQEYVWTLKAV